MTAQGRCWFPDSSLGIQTRLTVDDGSTLWMESREGNRRRFRKKPPEETFSGLRCSGPAEHRLLPATISSDADLALSTERSASRRDQHRLHEALRPIARHHEDLEEPATPYQAAPRSADRALRASSAGWLCGRRPSTDVPFWRVDRRASAVVGARVRGRDDWDAVRSDLPLTDMLNRALRGHASIVRLRSRRDS